MGNFFNSAVSTALGQAFGSPLNPSTISRSNNAVEYHLPGDLGGLNGQIMLSAGENANAQGGFKYSSGRLGYRNGALHVSVYHGATRIDAAGTDLKQSGVAGSYNFGVARVSGSVTQSKYLNARQTNLLVGVAVPVGVGRIRASYNRADQKGSTAAGASIDANDGKMFAVGYDHQLSKRTALYVNAARLSNSGAARFAIPGGPAGVAAASSSTGYELGMCHSF